MKQLHPGDSACATQSYNTSFSRLWLLGLNFTLLKSANFSEKKWTDLKTGSLLWAFLVFVSVSFSHFALLIAAWQDAKLC